MCKLPHKGDPAQPFNIPLPVRERSVRATLKSAPTLRLA